jgi:hypothetical protein
VLGTQLIRRNDELALLYEKIKIQQTTLQNGEIQYRERLQDIRCVVCPSLCLCVRLTRHAACSRPRSAT